MNNRATFLVATVMALSMCSVWAQEPTEPPATTQAEKESPPSTDHGKMDHGETDDAEMDHSKMDPGSASGADSGAMDHSGAGKMQGGSPPHDARDPHAYSDGYDFGEMSPLVLADRRNFKSLLADRLESVVTDDSTSATYDLRAWLGRDYNRVVFKAEGDFEDGTLEDAETELLWGHAVAAYWGSQLGMRYDSGEGPDRTWLAFGIQGLAPYWFEVDATGYIGDGGRTAFNFEAEYELLLTQKLILQPRIEVDWYGKSDPERGIGSGLSEAVVGLRLRFEIRRELAPYVGAERARKFGETEDLAQAAGEDPSATRFVVGLRFWF